MESEAELEIVGLGKPFEISRCRVAGSYKLCHQATPEKLYIQTPDVDNDCWASTYSLLLY